MTIVTNLCVLSAVSNCKIGIESNAMKMTALMLHKDGTCVDGIGNVFKVIPVPPHGDLIGRDALLKKCEFVCTGDDEDIMAVRYSIIENAPTVIPASGEGEE